MYTTCFVKGNFGMKKFIVALIVFAAVALSGCAGNSDEIKPYNLTSDEIVYEQSENGFDEMPSYSKLYETSSNSQREPVDIRFIAVDREDGLIVYHVENFFNEDTMMLCATPGGLAPTWYFPYSGVRFDTSSIRANSSVSFIFVDYRIAENKSAVHLNGIDGTSTRDDVVAFFGEQGSIMFDGFLPENRYSFDINYSFEFDIYDFPIRLSPSRSSVSYGYRLDNNIWVRFHFDENYNVIVIALSGWQYPFIGIDPTGQG